MDAQLFERLLYRGESESLDFKVDQYSFDTDDEKGEFLKDIIAFANAWRDSEAYILIGVQEPTRDKPASPLGITRHLNDNELQQLVSSKVQKPLRFAYEPFAHDGKQFGIITIPVQDRPFHLKKSVGKFEAERGFIRRGSSTGTASLDEIAQMGRKTSLSSSLEIHTEIRLRAPSPPGGFFMLYARLSNAGQGTAYEVLVGLVQQPNPGSMEHDPRVWDWRPGVDYPRLACKHPIHPGATENVANWKIGIASLSMESLLNTPYGKTPTPESVPAKYEGQIVRMRLPVFVRDHAEVQAVVEYSVEEVEAKVKKRFSCVPA